MRLQGELHKKYSGNILKKSGQAMESEPDTVACYETNPLLKIKVEATGKSFII